MNGIIITLIICVTIVALVAIRKYQFKLKGEL